MPTVSASSIHIALPRIGEWVLVEEIWKTGFWVDSNREMEVPASTVVRFRHNLWLPPYLWEVSLGAGHHGFHIVDGWNKFQVRLDTSPTTSSGILWIF